jgi:maltose alpha-D-glucosyltransferase/alpha-amylase
VIEVPFDWTTLFAPERRESLAPVLLRYATARRWFRSKARPILKAAVLDAVLLPSKSDAGAGPYALVLLEVTYVDGPSETYVLPLGFATRERMKQIEERSPHAVVTSVLVRGDSPDSAGGEPGLVFDALVAPEPATLLLDLIRDQRSLEGQRGSLAPIQLADIHWPAQTELEPRVSTAEQSNTNIIYGSHFILKMFRSLSQGTNPEYEMGRYLSEHGFPATARLDGALEYRARGREPATLAVLQRFVPNQGDAWAMTLTALERLFRGVLARPPPSESTHEEHEEPGNPRTGAPAARETLTALVGPYVKLAERLGQRTGELHITLAEERRDPAFAPEPFTLADQEAFQQSAASLLRRTFALLRTCEAKLPEVSRLLAVDMLAREDAIEAKFGATLRRNQGDASPLAEVKRIRCHGDYHLGQVLFTGDDFIIIDFEGEPARPLEERRQKRCPLVDVAGMLRSFDYAAAAGLRAARRPEDRPTGHDLALWAEAWRDWGSTAFLEGYAHATAGAAFIPSGPGGDVIRMQLLDLYLLEKCIYEIGYELNNRPDWVEIPLGGLKRLLARTA